MKPVVRPAILTAFLGYLLVVVALMFDLGQPWRVWHPLIMWNPHSVMFEVGWCVTLYTTVLSLEFSPIVFERLKWAWALRIVRSVMLPLVILGVILSFLHQSSLGSLFLIVPNKLHPLWYTPILPILFVLSAIGGRLRHGDLRVVPEPPRLRAPAADVDPVDLGRVALVVLWS